MQKSVITTVTLLLFCGFAGAQNLSSDLGKVSSQYAQAYLTPAVNAFGVDLNSGLFHTASVGGALPFGLNLYIGVQVGGAFISSSDKTFNLAYPDSVSNPLGGWIPATDSVINAPTIFGSKQKGVIETYTPLGLAQIDSTIGGLIKTSIAPVPIPQIGLGSLFGTDVMVRWLPKIKFGDYGSLQLFGWALRHSISQYIPLIPVDVAVQIGFQNFEIKDTSGNNLLKTSTFAANVEVSKTFAILTLYGGFQIESSKTDVNYTYTYTLADQAQESIPISFSVTGKNKSRALLGLDLNLGGLTINADYSIGAVNAATAGIGITI